MSDNNGRQPGAAILGCAGPALSAEERRFFADADPFGFILFARNIESPDQLRALTASLRDTVGREAPILIDQEGGRVRRLRPPTWRDAPAMRPFGDLHAADPEAAARALRLNVLLMALELRGLGVDVDCAPVLDVPVAGAHDIIGDRAFSLDPAVVATLGRVVADAFLEGGVYPVIKHIPGHGRAMADSHFDLPVVDAPLDDLRARDFVPFKALGDAPFAMTAHIVYTALDAARPATTSPTVIDGIIRGELGFSGLLMTDDLSMKALTGRFEDRASASLEAGCDLVLHCNGDMAEMTAVMAGCRPLDAAGAARWERVRGLRAAVPPEIDFAQAEAELARLLTA
ncbi:beta-N-acetylhexosaminidase [Novispirillum sp. DQ9]|uniref:beta-N-acetylhexosaminidase n=1 Tax=Novispirillum sp. DQ9 TaxID=3398612 RepID=UPI003C7CF6FE